MCEDVSLYHPMLLLIQQCKDYLNNGENYSVRHILREANRAAHLMAQLGKASDQVLHVLYQPPSLLCNILNSEAVSPMYSDVS